MILSILIDKDLFYSLLLSILSYVYSKILLYIFIYVPNKYIQPFIKPTIYINNLNLDSDLDSDSDLESDSDLDSPNIEFKPDESYYKEYDIILHLLNLSHYTYNILSIHEKINISPIRLNITINNFDSKYIYIEKCFLFNIRFTKDELLNTAYIEFNPFTSKLILFNYLCNNNINSKLLYTLYPQYKYIFIAYTISSKLTYLIVDLSKNFNIINKRNILFNNIKIK